MDDLEGANKGFEPASCWGVGRVQSGEGPGPRGWQDVGGLDEVREALQEAMELPTKYAALIAKCAPKPASCRCSQLTSSQRARLCLGKPAQFKCRLGCSGLACTCRILLAVERLHPAGSGNAE